MSIQGEWRVQPKALRASGTVVAAAMLIVGIAAMGVAAFSGGGDEGTVKPSSSNGSASYPAVGAVVWPDPLDARPAVSMQHVASSLETTPAAPQGLEGLTPSSIRLVDYENTLGRAAPGGSEVPSVPKQLAWFVEYDNVRHAISLPIRPGESGGASGVSSNPWVAVVVVSASTGAVLDAFDYSE